MKRATEELTWIIFKPEVIAKFLLGESDAQSDIINKDTLY